MQKIKQLIIIAVMFALASPAIVLASPPSPPILISGTVTIDGSPAPVGTEISAEINNIEISTVDIDSVGKYSIAIPSENFDPESVLVYVNDNIANTVPEITNSPVQKIDLSITTADPDPDPPPPPPPPSGGGGSGGGGGGDTTPPTNTSIIINSNNETTVSAEVVLTLSANGASQMMIANNSSFTGAEWETYAVEKNWVFLTGENVEKTVYAQFKDTAGNISNPIQDTIMLSIPTDEEDESGQEEEVIVLGIETDYRAIQLNKIINEAGYIYVGNADSAAQNRKKQRNESEETEIHNRYVARLTKGIDGLMQSNINAFINFILYSTETTEILGAGERAGVLNSYKSAFGKLPETEEEWQDAIKIANGRWPNQRSETAENNAKNEFKKVYKRNADMDNPNDNAAVTVIAYGLRPDNRNLDSEKAGIITFNHIYGYNPTSAVDWDIARAIAYSGAVR